MQSNLHIRVAQVTLGILGVVDIARGLAHTYWLRYSAETIAQMDPHPDALLLLGVFGNSNFLTAGLFLLIVWQAPRLAGWVLGLIPAAIVIGAIGIRLNDVTMQSAFNGQYMMRVYLSVCVLVFAYWLVSELRLRRAARRSAGSGSAPNGSLSESSNGTSSAAARAGLGAITLLLVLSLSLSLSCGRDGVSPAAAGPQWVLNVADEAPGCVAERGESVPILNTAAGVRFVRTPAQRFAALPDYSFAPNYVSLNGLRMHYVDAGPKDGEVILLLHGQPSWSYLYRKMIPPLAEAGYRVIAPDLMGLGRSDKPIELGVHTFEQHVSWIKAFIRELELTQITLFAQDWGGLIGLRIAGDEPERFARLVAANTTLPVIPEGRNPFRVPHEVRIDCELAGASPFGDPQSADGDRGSEIRQRLPNFVFRLMHLRTFQGWINYALTAPDFMPSSIVEFATNRTLSPEEARAYDAPYPTLLHRAAIRTLPSMVAAIEQNNAPAWAALGEFERPFLFLGGEQDPNLGSRENQRKLTEHIPGAKHQAHARFDAHHFIQEDIGPVLADRVIRFMRLNPRRLNAGTGS